MYWVTAASCFIFFWFGHFQGGDSGGCPDQPRRPRANKRGAVAVVTDGRRRYDMLRRLAGDPATSSRVTDTATYHTSLEKSGRGPAMGRSGVGERTHVVELPGAAKAQASATSKRSVRAIAWRYGLASGPSRDDWVRGQERALGLPLAEARRSVRHKLRRSVSGFHRRFRRASQAL